MTASETNMKLMADIAELRATIDGQESERSRLEQQLQQLDGQRADLLRDGSDAVSRRPATDTAGSTAAQCTPL